HAVRDNLHRSGRGLAEVRVGGDLALDALAFGAEQIAHGTQLIHDVVDLAQRRPGDALYQHADVFTRALRRRLGSPAPRRDILTNEFADFAFEFTARVDFVVGELTSLRRTTHTVLPHCNRIPSSMRSQTVPLAHATVTS